jgi:hypothetical protein
MRTRVAAITGLIPVADMALIPGRGAAADHER